MDEEEELIEQEEDDEDESFSDRRRTRTEVDEEEEAAAPQRAANRHIQQSQLFQHLVLPPTRNPDEVRPAYQVALGVPLYQQLATITCMYGRATQGIKTPALFDRVRQQMTQAPVQYDF
jgi:hypothetical protein